MASLGSNEDIFMSMREAFLSYPKSLCQTTQFGHTLETYADTLDKTEPSMFETDEDSQRVRFVDLHEGKEDFKVDELEDLTDMKAHLPLDKRDPVSRFVLFQSFTNRSQLACSREQFSFIMTHHQVMARFLDHAMTFRRRQKAHLTTAFRHENLLGGCDLDIFELPTLGRSGVQLQHCFNLLGVERNERYDPKEPDEEDLWQIRQTAAYHSFDLVEGRSLWMLIKGNGAIRDRIISMTKNHRAFTGSNLDTKARRFAATLITHRVLLEWCAENWNEYIDFLESQGRAADKARLLKVTEMAKHENIVRHMSRHNTSNLKGASCSRRQTVDSQSPRYPLSPTGASFSERVKSWGRSDSGPAFELRNMLSFGRATRSPEPLSPVDEKAPSRELPSLVDCFSFQELQVLTRVEDRMGEAQMVLEQNQRTIREIVEHYKELLETVEFQKHFDDIDACRARLKAFFQQVKSIEKTLENAQCRLQHLTQILNNNKDLYYGVLQFENMETSKVYAKFAKISTERMEAIARKTEQETVSMHVITLFTLVFLPGTFIAVRYGLLPLVTQLAAWALTLWQTFFSSGVFRWNDNDDADHDWEFRGDAMKLFGAVSLPIMVVVLGSWFLVYKWVRRVRPTASSIDELLPDPVPGPSRKQPSGDVKA